MTLLYILMLWVAISFFLAGLWIVWLEGSRYLLRRKQARRASRRISHLGLRRLP